jgi:hypothetical protein
MRYDAGEYETVMLNPLLWVSALKTLQDWGMSIVLALGHFWNPEHAVSNKYIDQNYGVLIT